MRQPPPKRQQPKRETLDDIFGPSAAAPKQETLDDIFGPTAPAQPAAVPTALAEEIRQPMGPTKAIGTVLSTAFPGAPAGAAALGAAFSREPGESFQEAYKRRMREIGEEERQAKEELYPGMGTALQLGTAGAALARAPLVGARVAKDAPVLQKALAAGKRIVGGGLVAGAESAGRQGMDDKELSPAESAALGAGLTAGMEAAFPAAGALIRGASRIPIVGEGATALVRSLAGPTAEAVTQARRGIADYLAPRFGQRGAQLAQMVEPTDITRIQRQAASTLPGGVTGPTTAMMPGGNEAIAQAVRQAEAAAAQAQQQVKSARLATSQAKQARAQALEEVGTEEGARVALGRQRLRALGAQAEETERIGKGRRETLTATAKAAEEEAKQLQRESAAQLRETAAATRQQAKLAAEDVLTQARTEATEAIGTMRGTQPRGTAKRLQETVRSRQTREAQGHYAAVRQLGAPPEPDPGIYKEIAENATLSNALEGAVESLQRETRNLPPGAAMPSMRTVLVDNVEFPEITLEMMDRLRRKVMEPQMRKGPNVVGLSRSQKAEALETINRLEERYLAGFGSDEAAEALRTARSAYRERFQILEAVQDGLNLGSAKAGKASGLLTQSRKELDEVATRVENMTPKQQAAFRVGAREWFDRVIQENPADALKIAQKFSSEASQRRLALAYGDDAVESLRAFAPDVVGKRQAAAAAKVREEGTQLAQQIARRGEEAATPLTARAERARALAERARAQGQERAQALREEARTELEGRVQAGQLRLAQTQRAAGAPVQQAREAQRAAEEQAAQLAEQLTQARIARSQAKALPVGDLERALGSSTAQQTFLQRTLPQMSPEQRTQAVQVLGSNVQRRLQDLARQGESPERILREINQLKQNDAVRTLFGPQMDAFAQSLVGRQSMLLPFRTAVAGQAAGRF